MHIRKATNEDSAAISQLAGQLGYPTAESEVRTRLEQMLDNPAYHVAVAVIDGRVIAWVTVEKRLTLESGIMFEVTGLVVDSGFRRKGAATALLNEAESWVRKSGGASVKVRSNVVREESHVMYVARGFSRQKTQHVYDKPV